MHNHPSDTDDIDETPCGCCHRWGYDEVRLYCDPATPSNERIEICDDCLESELAPEMFGAITDRDDDELTAEQFAALKAITKPWPTETEQMEADLLAMVQRHGIATVQAALNLVSDNQYHPRR